MPDNADLTPLQRQIEARAYQTTLDEARADEQRRSRQITDLPRINPFNGNGCVTGTPTLGIPHPQQLGQQLDQAATQQRLAQQAINKPRPELIDTWSAHIQAQARIGQLERELADMTAELAYANLRMTVAIQTSNQLLEAEVARRKAEAFAFLANQTIYPNPVPAPPSKPAFPARALAPQRGDGWVMVR
jgi:hypothetical protein